jgi:hypothetical protein
VFLEIAGGHQKQDHQVYGLAIERVKLEPVVLKKKVG